jgi:aminomethyltransferase
VLINTQVRKSPYWHLSERHGCWAYTVLSNLYHPRAYVPLEEGGVLNKEHEYLTQAVTLWNVAAERQIAIKGPDALAFANYLVARDLNQRTPVGKARYTIICDGDGGIVNDPVLLRVADDEIWLSTHTEVLHSARGVRVGSDFDMRIDEVDVSPLELQGPYSKAVMESLVEQGKVGREVFDLTDYTHCQTHVDGVDAIISRTGFSGEVGYEVYPFNATERGEHVWDTILAAGEPYGIQVIAPGHIRRLEAADPVLPRLSKAASTAGGPQSGEFPLTRVLELVGRTLVRHSSAAMPAAFERGCDGRFHWGVPSPTH